MRIILYVLLLLCATSPLVAQNNADLILVNGKIWTGASEPAFTEAVAIAGNKIVAVGKSADIKKLAGNKTKLIDLQGKLVTAGINDAHIHFLSGSLGLSAIDQFESKTKEEAVAVVERFAKNHPEKKWLTGRGWQYSLFPGDIPTKELLDKVVSDRPVYIRAYDGHTAWVNSKALELAGINRDTKFNGFGKIYKDVNGEPTGGLTEDAMDLVSKFVPESSREEKLAALRDGMKFAARHGITTIQNASGTVDEFSLYEELLKNGELTLRASTAFTVSDTTTDEDINSYTAVKNRIGMGPQLRANCIKFFMDGVIESHTAAMLEPYSDVPSSSDMTNSDFALPLARFRELVTKFDKTGFQIYTHAIGDKSVRETLNAYENAQKINGTSNRRHRIEHIETSSPDDLPRFAKLGVLASMEPIHADPETVEVWSKAVGEKRLQYAFVWASLLKNKARLVFSSDWPACSTPIPIRGLHNAVNRRTINGIPANGWIPEQRVSMMDALIAYTQGGAYSSFDENVKGKILPGYLADIIVFSQDLFEIVPMDIYKTKILMTIFDGKIIYEDME
jgi:predicted amidohydrolase YtcJ